MRRLLIALAGAAALFVLGAAAPAAAAAPFRLGGQITDQVGALGGREPEVRQSVDALRAANGTQLYVVYVASFDGLTGQAWADQAASLSQLGRRDVLLAVAVGDRAYGFSVDADYPLSNATIDDITARSVEPRLAAGDSAGAAIAMADGLRTGSTGGAGGSALPVVAAVGGLVLLGGGAYLLVRRARRRRAAASQPTEPPSLAAPDEFAGVSTEDLGYRASAALIDVDDAVRTSEQELLVARGQFGDGAVGGFFAALEASRADLVQAFELRQQLDDGEPETDPKTRVLLAEILRLCRAADERLDQQSAAFDRLRDLERTAPDYVAGLGPRRDAVAARLPEVAGRLAALRERYAAGALAAVAGNVEAAQQRLDAAAAEIEHARAEVTAGRSGPAVVSGRAAEDAITQAETLLDAIPRLDAELGQAASRFADARMEIEQDLAEVRTVSASGASGVSGASGASGGLPALVARAEAAVFAAEQALRPQDGTLPDPLSALRRLDDAGAALDRGLVDAREAQARNQRAAALLDQALLAARSGVAAASDFVSTRRGAVGAEARTRLAEAQRHLDLAAAQADADPVEALREAQQADALADEALRLAQSDVEQWSSPYPAGAGGGGSGGIDLGSLVLGGILFGGGGWGGGGWAGGTRGGGWSPGSFGGSGTRGRRGGGGRF